MAKKKKMSCGTLKGGYIPTKIDNIHEHLQEINRGTGSHDPKKYTRKEKHKKKWRDF